MRGGIISWDSVAPAMEARVVPMAPFDARGMVRLYGRGDRFGSHLSFLMDIWKTADGRILMRCSSRRADIGDQSYEILGLDVAAIPVAPPSGLTDRWIPVAVRDAYEAWIDDEMP